MLNDSIRVRSSSKAAQKPDGWFIAKGISEKIKQVIQANKHTLLLDEKINTFPLVHLLHKNFYLELHMHINNQIILQGILPKKKKKKPSISPIPNSSFSEANTEPFLCFCITSVSVNNLFYAFLDFSFFYPCL